MRVRKFRPEDAKECSRIILHNFRTINSSEDPKATIRKLIEDSSPKKLIEKSKERKYFVAVEKEGILGIGGYDKSELHTFFVKPKLHGKGVGKKIIKRVLDEARKDKIKVMKCASSLYAEKFYASFGFKRVRRKTIPFHRSTLTFIEMVKKL